MGIWIRTQNKRRLLYVNGFNIFSNIIKGNYEVLGYDTSNPNDSDIFSLGTFSSYEKAFKVLDMIQKCISMHNDYIYVMPQDSEVVVNDK